MPRSRMIWPEHLAHPSVTRLSDLEYRLWIGLLQLADDEGRVRADVAWIKAQVRSNSASTPNRYIARALIQIASTGLIRLYEVNGDKYAYFPSWGKWQHPRFPTRSKLPDPLRYGSPTVDLRKAYGAGGVVKDKDKDKDVDSKPEDSFGELDLEQRKAKARELLKQVEARIGSQTPPGQPAAEPF